MGIFRVDLLHWIYIELEPTTYAFRVTPNEPDGSVGKLPVQKAQKTQVPSKGLDDPLEEEVATHSRVMLAWKIPWAEEPGRHSWKGHKEFAHDNSD